MKNPNGFRLLCAALMLASLFFVAVAGPGAQDGVTFFASPVYAQQSGGGPCRDNNGNSIDYPCTFNGAKTCYTCDSDGNGMPDSCGDKRCGGQCTCRNCPIYNAAGQVTDYGPPICDLKGDGTAWGCPGGPGCGLNQCPTIDTNSNGYLDACVMPCKPKNIFGDVEATIYCDFTGDGIGDACPDCDTDGDGAPDSCSSDPNNKKCCWGDGFYNPNATAAAPQGQGCCSGVAIISQGPNKGQLYTRNHIYTIGQECCCTMLRAVINKPCNAVTDPNQLPPTFIPPTPPH